MAPERLRVGVVGGGLIAQAVHLPNLRRLGDRFAVAALADPSRRVREALAERFAVASTYADWNELLAVEPLDAVVVCSPNGTHAAVALAAIERGLHVLVEKPLCIRVDDADAIVAAQREAAVVVQVGYMKRYDAAYERLLDELPGSADELRLLSTVMYDPDMTGLPYFRPGDLVSAADVDPELIAAARADERAQIEQEIGAVDDSAYRAYNFTFLSALVHEVNLLNGVLERVGHPPLDDVVAAGCWADGNAGSGTFRLRNGAHAHCTWLWLEGLVDYRETLEVYAADAVQTLSLPAPYLGRGSRYTRNGASAELQEQRRLTSLQESYVDELLHFHACVTEGLECRTPAAQARADIAVLRAMFRLARGDG